MGEARGRRQKPLCFGDVVEACVGASPGSRRRRKCRSRGTERPTIRDRRRLPPAQSVRWFPRRSSSTESVTRRTTAILPSEALTPLTPLSQRERGEKNRDFLFLVFLPPL